MELERELNSHSALSEPGDKSSNTTTLCITDGGIEPKGWSKMKVTDTGVLPLQWKVSAMSKGYFTDPYLKYFMAQTIHSYPATNRRLWARIESMDQIQLRFLSKRGNKADTVKRQIINIGCGFNTFSFNLMDARDQYCPFVYYELDLPEVVKIKVKFIHESTELSNSLNLSASAFRSELFIKGEQYGLTNCDLTDLEGLKKQLEAQGADFTLPTLLVTDFVLPYIRKEEIQKYLEWACNTFDCAAILDYSLVNSGDPTGLKLAEESKKMGLDLIGKDFFCSLDKMKSSYEGIGFLVEIRTLKDMYYKHLDQKERKRIEAIEEITESDLDEHFLQKLDHHAVTYAKSKPKADQTTDLRFEVLNSTMLL